MCVLIRLTDASVETWSLSLNECSWLLWDRAHVVWFILWFLIWIMRQNKSRSLTQSMNCRVRPWTFIAWHYKAFFVPSHNSFAVRWRELVSCVSFVWTLDRHSEPWAADTPATQAFYRPSFFQQGWIQLFRSDSKALYNHTKTSISNKYCSFSTDNNNQKLLSRKSAN